MIRSIINNAGNRILKSVKADSLEEAAMRGAKLAAKHLGPRIPMSLKNQLPNLSMTTLGWVLTFEEGKLSVSPFEETPQPNPGEVRGEGSEGFWQTLPKGIKTGIDDIDGEKEVINELPSNEGDVRSLIQRLRDTIEGLDDVNAYDVVESVDDDMYQLWRELERKMQTHKRSEAKHQLKGMFDI